MTAHHLPATLGRDLRALRKTRGLTLQSVSKDVQRSVGWLSQVERDLSEPSKTELRALSDVLGVPLSTFFSHAPAPAEEDGIIVRKNARRQISRVARGLTEELLSPDLTDAFEVVHSTFAPGASRKTPLTRPTQEVGYVVSGQLDLTVEGRTFTVTPGDSFRIREQAFAWSNPYDIPCVAIWVIAPPVY